MNIAPTIAPVGHEQAQVMRMLPATMQAAVIAAPRTVVIQEAPLPLPQAHEVLVKLEGCGVCGSNLPLWEGREWFTYPTAPGQGGHESWGQVVALGEAVRDFALGERVAMLSNQSFAEYAVAAASATVKLPASLADQPFPAEPLACAMNVFARSGIGPGKRVAVVGIGFLGALLTGLAANAGAEVIAMGRRESALELARHYGAAYTIPMHDHWQIIEQVRKITSRQDAAIGGGIQNDEGGCDVVIEAVGAQWPLDLAAELTRIRGRLVIAGYHQDGLRQVNMQLWNWRGLDVINAHERDEAVYVAGMLAAVAAVAGGKLDPTPLYTHTLPLAQLDQAFGLLAERPDGFMKALICM